MLDAAARWSDSADEARDLVQEVLTRMLSTEGWQAITNPKTYMLRMIRNMVIDRVRRAKVVEFRHLVDHDDFDVADDAPDQHRVTADRQMLAEVAEAVEALPERCRIVFERCRVEGHSPKDIAAELGLSLSTLEKRLARAIHLLALALEPRRGDPYETSGREPETRRRLRLPN
nr:sigma-70 family RNA polymerase sigma factor [Sphingomonas kyeonggiensis]